MLVDICIMLIIDIYIVFVDIYIVFLNVYIMLVNIYKLCTLTVGLRIFAQCMVMDVYIMRKLNPVSYPGI